LVVDAKGTATAVWLESRALYVARHDVESGWASVVSPEYATTTPEDLRVIARAAHEVVVVWLGAPAYTSDWDADGRPDYGQGYGTDGVRALSLRPQFGALEVEITSPNNGTVTSNASIWVSGHATPGARLVVAHSIVEIATDGTFGVSVNLTLGANTISAEATRAGWLPASDAVTVTRVAAAPVDGSSAAKGGTILAVSPPDVFFLILLLLGFLGALTFVWLQIRRTRDAPSLREPRL